MNVPVGDSVARSPESPKSLRPVPTDRWPAEIPIHLIVIPDFILGTERFTRSALTLSGSNKRLEQFADAAAHLDYRWGLSGQGQQLWYRDHLILN